MAVLELLKNRAGASWLFLVAATVVSWAVGAEHGTGSTVAVLVLGIAAIKVRLVGLDFMEGSISARTTVAGTGLRRASADLQLSKGC
ncbi:cytochrome C oxidase subunit IV family protein [Mycolicibacterium diernhoferi]|uniref:Uncharacterized protein n=1 Tax=Mycolicibacterium diernhoferi TaxID=1801 RepID=A0A1T3W4G6_9MYCO|nr:cytochrome C oxidase subunit IV family protein [Mycolicibacterium diernhoferi]OPE49235.1 hypothetical protein BV510_22550 [Mycolicibacterium diernhoferi]